MDVRRRTLAAAVTATLALSRVAAAEEPPAPLPPTSANDVPRGFLLDGNAGLPVATEGKSSLAFDVTTGYFGAHFGAQLYVSHYEYSLQTGDNLSDTNRFRALAQLRWLTGDPGATTRLEVRGEADLSEYNTTVQQNAASANFSVADEGSEMLRLSLLAGLRFVPAASTRAFVLVGAGAQQQNYMRTAVNPGGVNNLTIAGEETSSESFRYQLRAGAWRSIASGLLSVRPEVEASRFDLERTTLGFNSDDPTTLAPPKAVTFSQTEAKARLFVHLEVASFTGLAPMVFAGADYFSFAGEGKSASSLRPIVGVGIANAIPVDY